MNQDINGQSDRNQWGESGPYAQNNAQPGDQATNPPFHDLKPISDKRPAYGTNPPPQGNKQPYYTQPIPGQRGGPGSQAQQADPYRYGGRAGQRRARPAYNETVHRRPEPIRQMFSKIFQEILEFLKAFFSAKPARALQQDLSNLSWAILLLVNILFFGLSHATIYSKMLGGFDVLSSLPGFSWGSFFVSSLLIQAIGLLILFLAAWILGGRTGSPRLAPVQYLKMVSYATPLQSIVSLILIIVALIDPTIASLWQLADRCIFCFTFIFIYDSIYEDTRDKRYWAYVILFAVYFLVIFLGGYLGFMGKIYNLLRLPS